MLTPNFNAFVVLIGIIFSVPASYGDICCSPDQFEAFLIFDDANVFIDANAGTAYSYINGSVRVAYDYTRRFTYFNVSSVELSPLVPQPIIYQYEMINDYTKGVQYQFTDVNCIKSSIGTMQKLCIPDNAMQLSHGFLGQNQTQVVTYQYTVPGSPFTYTTTVNPTACLPFMQIFISGDVVPDSGSMNSMLVSDITPGIKNPALFVPPKICLNNGTSHTEEVLHILVALNDFLKDALLEAGKLVMITGHPQSRVYTNLGMFTGSTCYWSQRFARVH